MSSAFSRDSSLTDEDTVGEGLIHEEQPAAMGFRKLAIASVCGAALVMVGYAAGSRQSSRQVLRSDAFVTKATMDEAGRAFSEATAGKSWEEIENIKTQMMSGQGPLGATYAGLSAVDQGTFLHSLGLSAKTSAATGAYGAHAVYGAMTASTGALACTANGEDCSASRCCSEAGMTCYMKNAHWSSCNQTCNPNMLWVADAWQAQAAPVWDCTPLTPGH